MAQIYYDQDADLKALEGKTVSVIGFGSQGRGQSLCLRDSGVKVLIGVRPGKSRDAALAEGMEAVDTEEAAAARRCDSDSHARPFASRNLRKASQTAPHGGQSHALFARF